MGTASVVVWGQRLSWHGVSGSRGMGTAVWENAVLLRVYEINCLNFQNLTQFCIIVHYFPSWLCFTESCWYESKDSCMWVVISCISYLIVMHNSMSFIGRMLGGHLLVTQWGRPLATFLEMLFSWPWNPQSSVTTTYDLNLSLQAWSLLKVIEFLWQYMYIIIIWGRHTFAVVWRWCVLLLCDAGVCCCCVAVMC